jgi:hypothetical protein
MARQNCRISCTSLVDSEIHLSYFLGAHPEFFIARMGGGADDPEAMYYLFFILKSILQKSCPRYNCQINCLQLHA